MSGTDTKTENNNPPIPVGEMVHLQTRRFTEQINEVIGTNCNVKITFQDHIVVHAKVNTEQKLKGLQFKALMGICESWSLENINVSRSGAGLKIEFNPDYNGEELLETDKKAANQSKSTKDELPCVKLSLQESESRAYSVCELKVQGRGREIIHLLGQLWEKHSKIKEIFRESIHAHDGYEMYKRRN